MAVNNEMSVPMLDADRMLELILSALSELIEYELAVVLGLDDSGTLRVRKAAGPLANDRLAAHIIDLHSRRDLARIMERGVPRLFAEDEDHIDSYDGVLDLPHGHSCLLAPLVVGDRRLGLLTLDHRECGKFTPVLVRFIGTISKLISLSLAQNDQNLLLESENENLVRERNALLAPGYQPIAGLVGASDAWIEAIEALRMVAGTELPVLILGETGSGKELAAKAVHRLSARAHGPWIALNCSALAQSLAESELFGHEKGSFTGAMAVKKGRFELADGGTLFLDEIGDLPMELQPKLLRVLQEGSLERVGSERSLRVDVRVVAATHVDLADAVACGRFREDLFYRLSVFPLRLPPLMERDGDALLLAQHFLAEIRERPGFSALSMNEDAARAIGECSWPGNVRQLRNALERAAILARGAVIAPEHLDLAGTCTVAKRRTQTVVASPVQTRTGRSSALAAASSSVPGTLDEVQRRAINDALAKSNGKLYGPGGAAELLSIKPTTLQSRMKKLGIRRQSPVLRTD